jgi:SAM-dependent methyltransferase
MIDACANQSIRTKHLLRIWNERAGDEGEAYKKYVLDPIMLPLAGDLRGKAIVDAGCGNGYLGKELLTQDPRKIIMLDISPHNLANAAKRCVGPSFVFLEQDATQPWKLETETIDVVYSNMMLNELEDIEIPMEETFRILRPGGTFIFSTTHPAWDLLIHMREKAGEPQDKIKGLGNYFRRGAAIFIMRGDTKSNPALKDKYPQDFNVEHYQRPLSDYTAQLLKSGFTITNLLEPPLSKAILAHAPRFAMYADHPIGLILQGTKPR